MMVNFEKVYLSSCFLCAFRELREDVVFKSFVELLKAIIKENDFEKNIQCYCDFVFELNNLGYDDFSLYIKDFLLKNKVNANEKQIQKELKIIYTFLDIQYQSIKEKLLEKYPNRADLLENLAEFKNSKSNIDLSFVLNNDFCEDIYKNNKAFIFDNDFDIKPVEFSETLNFSSLKGYGEQKRILKENTKALLNGSKVNNILLYGDAGCGKSK